MKGLTKLEIHNEQKSCGSCFLDVMSPAVGRENEKIRRPEAEDLTRGERGMQDGERKLVLS
jgi:hypothetical protein